MTEPLIVIGAGGHARVVLDAALSRPERWTIVGVADRVAPGDSVPSGIPFLGDDAEAGRRLAEDAALRIILGLAGNRISSARQEIVGRYGLPSDRWATVVHAGAQVSPSAILGRGAFVGPGAVINAGARIGDHVVVNTGAIVEHDVVLEPFAQVGPGAALGGGVVVGSGAFLGLGCRIRDHVSIGGRAMVAMGAVVVKPVEAGAVVMGVPARP